MIHPGHLVELATSGKSLANSLAKVGSLQTRTEVRHEFPNGIGWKRCIDLLEEPAGFTQWQELLDTWLRQRYDTVPRRTTAGYVMSWYLYIPAYIGALLFHHERRVPSLRPNELGFQLSPDRPHPIGIAVLGKDFYCLPSDPGSTLPEATAVLDDRALAAVLRARYIAHARQFVQTYAAITPLSSRTLWSAATDALDNCLWWAGKQGGSSETEGAAVTDAALVLDERHEPLTSASTLRLAEDINGRREWTRRRESCCFSYLLPGVTECESCPRINPRG